jgi:PIN domain nuclease of toxin-antitoxin system
MARYVLDASALLALLGVEGGSEIVVKAITEGAAISTVNLSEIVAKLSDHGMSEEAIHEALDSLELDIIDFDIKHAYRAGLLRPLTKRAGLSLGDRACLALAQQLNLPTLTTDRVWENILPNVQVQVIR